jgi:LPS-assembly protein
MPSLRHFSSVAPLLLVLSPLWGAAAEVEATCASSSATAATIRCPGDTPQLQGAQAVSSVLVPADEFEIETGPVTLDADDNLTAEGGVTIRQGDRELSADRVEVTEQGAHFDVSGNVVYRDPQLIVHGDAGNFENGEAAFEGVRFELPQRPARGGATSMSVSREGVLTLSGVEYTTCPPEHDDWLIRADSVSIDTERSVGTARDARVEFFGVPLLRLPVITFPVGNARKSGVLFPNIGSSTSGGLELAVPYYFNLAPQQDLTLTPTWYSNRGIDLGGEYRYLTSFGNGGISGNVLPGDSRSGGTRSRLRVTSLNELSERLRLTVDAENVSDTRYLEDFARGTSDASTTFLPRSALLAYRDDRIDIGLLWRNFQTLDAALPCLHQATGASMAPCRWPTVPRWKRPTSVIPTMCRDGASMPPRISRSTTAAQAGS